MAAITTAILAATAAIGTGLTAYGTVQSMNASKTSSDAAARIAADLEKQEALRKKQMELDARRRRLETIRNAQKARALALSNANSQGALFGSGLQGGYGQISGEANNQLLGNSQALMLGRENFAITSDINYNRMIQAQASGSLAEGQGFASLGGSLIQSLGAIKGLSGGFGSGSNGGDPYYSNGFSKKVTY